MSQQQSKVALMLPRLLLLLLLQLMLMQASLSRAQTSNSNSISATGASLAIVFDTTGSMKDDLVGVKRGVNRILREPASKRGAAVANYILVRVNEPVVSQPQVTSDPAEFQEMIEDIFVQGGGDCPEATLQGIKLALEAALPRSFIYVFTDASAKDSHLLNPVLELIQQKESQVVFVLTGDCGDENSEAFQCYQRISQASSGILIRILKNRVLDIMNLVNVALTPERVHILSVDKELPDENNIYDIPIDSTVKYFTVSVSGPGVRIESLQDPFGRQVLPAYNASLPNLEVKSVSNPILGHWTLKVNPPKPDSNGKAKHSIRVTGRSKLDFSHAFSTNLGTEFPAKTGSANASRPYLGIPSHLYINQTQSLGTVHYVALTTFEKYSVITAPARQLSGSVFVTDRMEPPSGFFYVVVRGKDAEGRDYQRYSPTAVKALIAPAPRVECRSLDIRVRRGDWANLRCEVFSTKDYLSTWYKLLGENRKQVLQSTSSPAGQRLQTLDLKEVDATASGVYELVATTIDGQMHSDRVQVTVLPDPPTVLIAPVNVSASVQGVANLRCLVAGEPTSMASLLVEWFRGGPAGGTLDKTIPLVNSSRVTISEKRRVNAIDKKLEIRYVTLSDAGEYTCRATYLGDGTSSDSSRISNSKSTWLIVHDKPVVLRLSPEGRRFTYRRNETIRIDCIVVSGPSTVRLGWWRQSSDRLVSSTGRLQITNAGPRDAGSFECRPEVASRNASSFKSVELVFHEAPSVKAEPDKVLVSAGRRVSLYCAIIPGVPTPTITWRRRLSAPSSPIENSTRVDRGGSSITFVASDATVGEWICSASNEAGTAEATIRVSIAQFLNIDPISSTQSPLLVERGRPIELVCRVNGRPQPSVTWTKDNGKGIFIDIAGANIDQEGQRLRLERAELSDAGSYRCTANNSLGSQSRMISVMVGQAPTPVKNTIGPEKFVFYSGETRQLSCNVTAYPKPEFLWYQNGSQLDNRLPELTIQPVVRSSAGRYSCSARNQFGMATLIFDVRVISKPLIIPPTGLVDSRKLVPVNASTLLECRLSEGIGDDNSLEVIWLKDGSPIDSRIVDIVQNTDGTKSLLIRRVDRSDSGKYTCIVSNKAGLDSLVIDLTVIYPPYADSTVQLIQRSAGQNVSIFCKFTDGMPPAAISWQYVSSTGSSNSRIKLSPDRKLLTIQGLVASDTGNYDCTATNRLGSATSRVKLLVSDPPLIDRDKLGGGTLERWILRNRGINLPCPIASGSPRPVLTWSLNGATLASNASNGLIVRRDGEVLEILSARPEHQGLYRCEATNQAGSDAIELILSVVEAPVIGRQLSADSVRVKTGETINIECRLVNGTRLIDLSWTRNGIPITESNRLRLEANGERLVIRPSELSDTGNYACLARNRFGQDTRQVTVNVTAPLRFLDNDIGIYVVVKVVENQSVSLDCSLESKSTEASYLWIRHGYGPVVSGSISTDPRRLFLRNVSPDQAGNYTCTAGSGDQWLTRYFKLVVNSPPTLREGLEDVNITVNVRQFVSLQCTVDGALGSAIRWLKDGVPVEVLVSNGAGYLLTETGSQSSALLITSARHNDTGTFVCRAENEAGSVSKRHHLVLRTAPEFPPGFDSSREIRQVNVQDFVELACPATIGLPSPTISWRRTYRDGSRRDLNEANIDPRRISILDGGQRLLIFSAALSDSGQYTCLATNTAGQIAKVYDLQVTQKPNILGQKSKTIVSTEGDGEVQLPCEFEAFPEPSVSWLRNGRSLATGGRYRLRRDSLVISQVLSADRGLYTCVVVNSAGQDLSRVQLQVLVKPSIIDGPYPRTVAAKRGGSVKLNCSAIGEPEPRISWKRAGNVITESRTYQLVGNSLIINNLEAQNAGLYICEAANSAGTAVAQFQLQILLSPLIEQPGSTLKRVPSGQDVLLECRATGDPQPVVTWSKSGSQIYWNNPFYRLLDSGGLQISNVRPSDAGTFRCTARNSAGAAVLYYRLEVIDRPTVSAETPVVSVTLTTPDGASTADASLRCRVNSGSVPTSRLSWWRNGIELTSPRYRQSYGPAGGGDAADSMSLKILRVRQEDDGQYECRAENAAGEGSDRVLLRTLVPPSVDSDQIEVAGPPEVSHSNAPNYNFFMDGWMQLRCRSGGRPQPQIAWYHNGTRVPPGSSVTAGPGSGVYSVYRLTPGDSGLYECHAKNEAGNTRRLVANVTVLGAPEVLSLRHSTDQSGLYPTVTLTCSIRGIFTQLEWTRNGQALQTGSGGRYSDYGNGTLVIRRALASDSGRYACSARNPSGSGRAELWLPPPPDGRPRFLDASPVDKSARAGEPLELNCPGRLVGKPTPTVYWLKDGVRLGAPASQGTVLTLANPQAADSGVYKCVAENQLGASESPPIRLRIFVDGGYSTWSAWSACSVTCGPGGWTRRSRRCDSPTPRNGGADCVGPRLETRGCWERDCVVRRTCAEFGHTCQAGCQDTPTGFQCVCPRGYALDSSNGRRCLDVNECLATSGPPPCPAFEQCLNTIGSYHCRAIQCPAGYIYDTRQRVCLQPCKPGDPNCNSTTGERIKFIVINVLPKHSNFTLKIIDSRRVDLRFCNYRLLQKSPDAPFDIRSSAGRVTIVRTPDPDLAGKLGRMFQLKIKAECYRGAGEVDPIFRTTFNVYISIAAYNYGVPTLQFLFPRFNLMRV